AKGLSPLFTCSICGTFCCCDCYVDIHTTDEFWQVTNRYDCVDSEKQLQSFSYQVPSWQIQEIVAELREAIQSIRIKCPYLQKYVGNCLPAVDQRNQFVAECPYLNTVR